MVRKLSRQLGIRLDYDEIEKLFFRRLDDSGTLISRGFEANFDEPVTDQERRIKEAIDLHRSRLASKMEKDLFTQKTRFANAQRQLKDKETKKAREDVRISTNKIETLSTKLTQLRSSEPNEEDNRIFPFVYAGVIVKQDGQNLLTPMRYHCRPAGKPTFYDRQFPGLYNARRDNLEKFWSEQFGSHHAILVVESFYENVKRHTMEHRELLAGEAEEFGIAETFAVFGHDLVGHERLLVLDEDLFQLLAFDPVAAAPAALEIGRLVDGVVIRRREAEIVGERGFDGLAIVRHIGGKECADGLRLAG